MKSFNSLFFLFFVWNRRRRFYLQRVEKVGRAVKRSWKIPEYKIKNIGNFYLLNEWDHQMFSYFNAKIANSGVR